MIKTNIIKKITALSVSCTLSVALLAGCGNSDNSQKDTTAMQLLNLIDKKEVLSESVSWTLVEKETS